MDLERIIKINDPVYSFSEVMAHIDLKKYFVEKGHETGRPRYDREKLLKIVLFAFMEFGYFNCSNYKGNRGTCESTHYVRVDFLEQVVLGEIKRLTKYAVRYEDDFLKAIIGSTQRAAETERKLKKKELAILQARDNELDGLYERIYEDNLAGKLSDERYKKMANRYENEQAEISERIKKIRSELDRLNSQSMSTDMFISTIRQYTRAKKLTPRMVNELIERIEVHQSEKIDGEWVQKLTIYYNCIGALFIPDTENLPVPNVTMNTRRGVYVTYEPAQNE